MKIDMKTHAFLANVINPPPFSRLLEYVYHISHYEEDPDDGLYWEEARQTFRYLDPVVDKQSKNPRYWSEATLDTWLERLCYDL